MLSARGAMATPTILSQAVMTRPSSAKTRITLPEVERAWAALCRVLRAQLLLGHPVTLFRHTCSFWFKQQHVVTDGSTKYYRRVAQFGFNPTFATTYSFDAIVEREDQKVAFRRLPLDAVAAEARMAADHVAAIINEVFLFIGESLYSGRMLSLEFTGVATVLVKRERANISFCQGFVEDVFAIDSRKWPLAVREVALTAIAVAPARPASRGSSVAAATGGGGRGGSATPRPTSSFTAAAVAPRGSSPAGPTAARPSFVSAAAAGKLFSELAAGQQQRRRPASAAAKVARRSAPGGVEVRPLRGKGAGILDRAREGERWDAGGCEVGAAPLPLLHAGDAGEEESVYSMLSPHRDADVRAAPLAFSDGLQQQQQEEEVDENEDAGETRLMCDEDASGGEESEGNNYMHFAANAGGYSGGALHADPSSAGIASRPPSSRVQSKAHPHTDIFFAAADSSSGAGEALSRPLMHVGRRRVVPLANRTNDIRSILEQRCLETPSEAGLVAEHLVSARARRHHHAAEVDHVGSLLRQR